MITYTDFQRICRAEGVAERFIEGMWRAREGLILETGRDPAHKMSEKMLRDALKMIMRKWPHLLKEPS